jgi:hypothetical protein
VSSREVTYTYLHPTGGEAPNQQAQLAQFLGVMPHLFYFGYMPPLAVVNTFLAEGVDDAGMSGGCRWEPFQISPLEYEQLIKDLRGPTPDQVRRPTRFDSVPVNIRTKNEWFAWVYHVELGAPFEEALRYLERDWELRAKRDALYAKGANDEGEAIHWEWFKAASEMNTFLEPYIEKRRNRRAP